MPSRRDFLGTLGAGAAAVTARTMPFGAIPAQVRMTSPPHVGAEPYDFSWPATLSTPHRAVFDAAAIESGRSVWRASIWEAQYIEHLRTPRADLSSVLVIRAEAISLVMQQAFWDRYELGKLMRVTHPVTQQSTDRNPALLSSTRSEIPPAFDDWALDRYIARGRAVLACDLAFREIVQLVMKADRVSDAAARERALPMLIPGVKLQPSGIFAVVRAQEAGAQYVRSS